MVSPHFLSPITSGIEATVHHRPLKALTIRLTSCPDPIKGRPHLGEAPHTPSPPPPTLYCARIITVWSQGTASSAPPPHHRPDSGEQFLGCAALLSPFYPSRDKPPWPRAIVDSMVEPWTNLPYAVHIPWTCVVAGYSSTTLISSKAITFVWLSILP
jgi:hypothetical protein